MTRDTLISVAEEDDQPIEVLDLNVRTYNLLKRSGINTISQLFTLKKEELLSIRNFGIQNYEEVRARLIARGLLNPDRPTGPFAENNS